MLLIVELDFNLQQLTFRKLFKQLKFHIAVESKKWIKLNFYIENVFISTDYCLTYFISNGCQCQYFFPNMRKLWMSWPEKIYYTWLPQKKSNCYFDGGSWTQIQSSTMAFKSWRKWISLSPVYDANTLDPKKCHKII